MARSMRIFKKERSLIIRRTSMDAVLDGSFVISEDQRVRSEIMILEEKNKINAHKN